MKEEWLLRGAVVPVDFETTQALVAEIKRLIDVVGDMALAQPEQEPQAFADLVAAQEREAWEQKFARLQNLMDVREIQPNKPCCLAARADERAACCVIIYGLCESDNVAQRTVDAIRARGTT